MLTAVSLSGQFAYSSATFNVLVILTTRMLLLRLLQRGMKGVASIVG